MASLSRLTERVGLTTLDPSGQPLDRVVEGLLAWAPHGRGSPSVAIVAEEKTLGAPSRVSNNRGYGSFGGFCALGAR